MSSADKSPQEKPARQAEIMKIVNSGLVSPFSAEISAVAADEKVKPVFIKNGITEGTIVIPKNRNRSLKKVIGIGKGLKTKVNANIGTSPVRISIADEIEKLNIAVKAGADAVMDLSTGGDINGVRRAILDE